MTLQDILKKWSHQAGCFTDEVLKETREKIYLESLMAVFSMFARHHTELGDGEFVRAFRFFKDAGFTKRLSLETSVAERYGKLERTEPGFEKKPEPIVADEKLDPIKIVREMAQKGSCDPLPGDIQEPATPENIFMEAEKKIKNCKHKFELDGGPCTHCGLTWIQINEIKK